MTDDPIRSPSTWAGYSPPLQALLDEYARAIQDLDVVVGALDIADYTTNTSLSDDDYPDIRAIMEHVIGAAYVYVDYIEDAMDGTDRGRRCHDLHHDTPTRAMESVAIAFGRMVACLGRRKDMTENCMSAVQFVTRWEQRYDLEQMLEHAIVHILRHRRQIQRWVNAMGSTGD